MLGSNGGIKKRRGRVSGRVSLAIQHPITPPGQLPSADLTTDPAAL